MSGVTAAPGSGITLDEVQESVSEIARAVLERDVIDKTIDLFDQGSTSLAFIRIMALLAERHGITIDVEALEEASIESLAAQMYAQINGKLVVAKEA